MTFYHEQDKAYRVVQFGKSWFVQHHNGSKGDRVNDPWERIGPAKESQREAIAMMYGRKPIIKAA